MSSLLSDRYIYAYHVVPGQSRRGQSALIWAAMSCTVLWLFAGRVYGQITTVIDSPPESAPNAIDSNTQLNLSAGGVLQSDFDAGNFDGSSASVEVNILGGSVGQRFDAYRGSAVNISGGIMGDAFRAFDGSSIRILGGEFRLDGVPVSGLETEGSTLAMDVPQDVALTGTLSDGTPFAFASRDGDSFAASTLTLETTALPPIGPSLITALPGAIPPGIRAGQTLLVSNGVIVPDSFNAGLGSTLIVDLGGRAAGSVGDNLEAVNAQVTISGGAVGDRFDAFDGSTVDLSDGSIGLRFSAFNSSTVNISGGSVGAFFDVFGGSTVNISGGAVGVDLDIYSGSTANISGGEIANAVDAFSGTTVNITGGTIADDFEAHDGSTVNIFGGSVGVRFRAYDGSAVNISGGSVGGVFIPQIGSAVTISGGEYRLDGVPLGGIDGAGDSLTFNLAPGSLLSGTLADGTPFAFCGGCGDGFIGEITLQAVALPAIGPAMIVLADNPPPLGIRAGQTLRVANGATLPDNFHAGLGSILIVEGSDRAAGSVGNYLEAVGAQITLAGGSIGFQFQAYTGSVVDITGGVVGNHFDALSGSTVNMSGGFVGFRFEAYDNSTVNIFGGAVGQSFQALAGSAVNITGGSIGDAFHVFGGSNVNIRGGAIGDRFHAKSGSAVNLFGTTFVVDGIDITGSLTQNEAFTINDRDVTLSGLLGDGTPFSFDLNAIDSGEGDFFDAGAFLTVTLIPEPTSMALLRVAVIAAACLRRTKFR